MGDAREKLLQAKKAMNKAIDAARTDSETEVCQVDPENIAVAVGALMVAVANLCDCCQRILDEEIKR